MNYEEVKELVKFYFKAEKDFRSNPEHLSSRGHNIASKAHQESKAYFETRERLVEFGLDVEEYNELFIILKDWANKFDLAEANPSLLIADVENASDICSERMEAYYESEERLREFINRE